MKKYLLGIDIGTSGCKCCLLDIEGNLVGNAAREYSPLSVKPGWSEQSPDDWYRAVTASLQHLYQKTGIDAKEIAAIGVAGQMRGLTFLDNSGKPVRNSILWNDLRCGQEVHEAQGKAGELLKTITHNPLNTMCTLPKVMWVMRNDSSTWKKTSTIIFPKDYINYRLTGTIRTDFSDASGSSFYNIHTQQWADNILDLFGIAREKLPAISASTDVIGAISQDASEETGLSKGTPVIAGGSDATVELFALGISKPTECKLRLGTSGAISTVVKDLENFPEGGYYCWSYVLPNHWMIDLNTRACAHSTVWLRDVFYQDKQPVGETYGEIARAAETIPPGADGLFFHPYLLGEDAPYWNPALKGSFFGITAHHSRSHFARAVLEGTAYALRDARTVIEDIAQHFEDYIFVGGGVKNALWLSIVTDVLGIDGKISSNADTAFGAAMLAGIGAEVFVDRDEAIGKCCHIEKQTVCFDKNKHEVYSEFFEKYIKMKKLYDRIYKLNT